MTYGLEYHVYLDVSDEDYKEASKIFDRIYEAFEKIPGFVEADFRGGEKL